MKKRNIVQALICILCVASLPFTAIAGNDEINAGPSRMRAAILVTNRAGKAYQDKIDILNDLITTRLTEKGFSILDKQMVADKFREARDTDAEAKKTIEAITGGEVDLNVAEALKDASALRLAQMIGADYIIVASLNSFGHTTKKFKGKSTAYGVDNEVTDYTLRVALKVLEAGQGGSIYGDVVKATERIPQTENLEIQTSNIINNLLEVAAAEISDNIDGRMEEIRLARAAPPGAVPFTVSVNGIEGATILLDGAALGSTGEGPANLSAVPGIHMMRVTRQWFTPWEKPVNIHTDQKLNITLKLSDAGIVRFKDLEGFKTEMAIARETSAADAYAKRLLAEGEKTKLEASYEKIDTSKVERLSVGDHTPRVIVEHEEEE